MIYDFSHARVAMMTTVVTLYIIYCFRHGLLRVMRFVLDAWEQADTDMQLLILVVLLLVTIIMSANPYVLYLQPSSLSAFSSEIG
jgi:hypothetical protein